MNIKPNPDSEANEQLLKVLRDVVIFAHKDKLERDGEFEYCRYDSEEPLSVEFHKSTLLEYDGLDWVSDSGGTYALRFKAIGKLEDELRKADVSTTFIIHLCEFNFRPTILIDNSFEKVGCFTGAYFEEGASPKEKDATKIIELAQKIDRLILLKKLKYA